MPDAFIYDHVRTPRGRGKVDGSLHEVTALNLASQALGAIKDRNNLDPTLVDDVVMGVVDPVGEAGADIARAAALVAGYGDSGRWRADQSLLRFRSRRGEFRFRADHVRTAGHGDRRRRRVDEPGRHRRVRRRLGCRSDHRGRALFHAARHFRRSDRDQIRILARRRRRLRGREPEARGDGLERRPLQPFGHEGEGRQRADAPRQGRAHAAGHDHAVARRAQAVIRADGRDGRLRFGRGSETSRSRNPSITSIMPAIRRASSMARRQFFSATHAPARKRGSSRGRACAPLPISAPSRRSC